MKCCEHPEAAHAPAYSYATSHGEYTLTVYSAARCLACMDDEYARRNALPWWRRMFDLINLDYFHAAGERP